MSTSGKVRWITTTTQERWIESQATLGTGTAGLRLTGTRHQTWEGFGGCFNEIGWHALSALDAGPREEIIAELFDPKAGCRFNLCRVPIGANDYALEWYSHNETPGDFAMERFSIARDREYLIPYIKAAQEHRPDLKIFASPWSPPTWFKFPRAYNYGTMIWKPEYLEAYAEYFFKFVLAYHEEGIPLAQVHVQNEPNSDQKFPSCLWTGAQMRDFIRDYLGPLFHNNDVDTEIWAGTIERSDYHGWAETILSDADARWYIRGVGYQWAGKYAVEQTHESWPDLRLMQTENECGDGQNTWDYAHYVFDLVRHYTRHGVIAYVYWNMALTPGGLSTWGWHQNAMITIDPATKAVTYNPEFYVMKHFAHFIEPGALRVGLAGPWAGSSVAFENPDGATIVVVQNTAEEARPFAVEVGGKTVAAELAGRSFNTFTVAP
jgi:glucosylceramidase